MKRNDSVYLLFLAIAMNVGIVQCLLSLLDNYSPVFFIANKKFNIDRTYSPVCRYAQKNTNNIFNLLLIKDAENKAI